MPPVRPSCGSSPFPCLECDKTFSRKEYLSRHVNSKHLGLKPFACLCSSRFGRSDLLARHKKSCAVWVTHSVTLAAIDPSFQPIAKPISTPTPTPPTPVSPPAIAFPASTSAAHTYGPMAHLMNDPMLPIPDFESLYSSESPFSFTQEEISASKVLDLLLRSPVIGSQQAWEPDTQVAWHGATANTTADNPSVLISDLWSTAVDTQEQEIENTPEALAMASYFSNGGIGISALDLGFVSTPTLFPPHLFSPAIPHTETDKKFFIAGQTFCLGYLYDWQVPPLATLSNYAETASTKLLQSVPVIHNPSLVMNAMTPHTAFALSVVGGAYIAEGEQFSTEMTVEKRVYLVRNFNKAGISYSEQFSFLQSLLLYQLLSLFHVEESHRKLSHAFHYSLVEMMRSLSLPATIRAHPRIVAHIGMTPGELNKAWKEWIKVETWKRVTFIVYMLDLETASTFETPALLSAQELCIHLPSGDSLWNAPNAEKWLEAYSIESTPSDFLTVLRNLLRPESTYPLKSELSTLSTFSLLILTRCLTSLKAQTERAISEEDPFKSLLGLGLIDERAVQNQIALTRILHGLKVLRDLPGGKNRGNAKDWFSNVMPSSKSNVSYESTLDSPMSAATPSLFQSGEAESSTSGSSEEDYLETFERNQAMERDGRIWRKPTELDLEGKQVKRVFKIIQDDFPGFSNPLYHV